jgi:ParB-like chromosome segregation protein Spo0J
MNVQYIPLNLITVPENYILTLHRPNTCDAIRVTGLMLPVVVKRAGAQYVLIDGYERLRCAREFGWREVPAIIVEDERVDVLRLALNYVRGRVCGIDVLLYTWQLSQQYDVSILARILGREYDTIRKYRSAAERILLLGLSREEVEELHRQCISLRRILRCADAHDKKEFFECLTYRPSGKKITPQLIKAAAEIAKDPEMRAAVDVVQTLGKDKVMRCMEIWDVARKTICSRLEQYRYKLLPEDLRLLELLCQ